MRSSNAIRADAWKIARSPWFWRILTVMLVLQFAMVMAMSLIASGFEQYGVPTWEAFLQAKVSALMQGMDYSVPSSSVMWQMNASGLFEYFMMYILSGILSVGFAFVALKAVRNDDSAWFRGSFVGFSNPFGMAMLAFRIHFQIFLWSLLFMVPGIIAFYRYRNAWYIKSDNPDWSAGQCLARSAESMKGRKWAAFSLDCSYWGIITVALLVAVMCMLITAMGLGFISALSGLLMSWVFLFAAVYMMLGHAVFYEDIRKIDLCAVNIEDVMS